MPERQERLERERLERGSSLHWAHWCVVIGSLVLTLFAWQFSSSQVEARVSAQFEREAQQVVALVSERMQKYEDALWAGTGTIQSRDGWISHAEWKKFADALRIEQKHPGINGIGVIYPVPRDERDRFVAEQRRERPEFSIHPEHEQPELLPIAYIEPVAGNRAAVGLDMAHEAYRYTAAKQARETGHAQITGPIVLVQDSQRTPGFLFFAPFYDRPDLTSATLRRQHFAGIVYAPFIVRKLMDGVLDRDRRHVAISIDDGESRIFDEHDRDDPSYDPEPLYSKLATLELYGRRWDFDIRSDRSFRALATHHQPTALLVAGIVIDALLLTLFVTMSRSRRRALRYADLAKQLLQRKANELERSNADLEQFAFVAAHDLQEPLRMVVTYSQLVERRYPQDDPKLQQYLGYLTQNARRMSELVQALLQYARIDSEATEECSADANAVAASVLTDLELAIDAAGAHVVVEELPWVRIAPSALSQVLHNLLENALKFSGDTPPRIRIFAEAIGEGRWRFGIEDDGIGMDPAYTDRIFTMFKRLHNDKATSGTGIGLAICKRLIQRQGGEIWVHSEPGKGSTFYFTLVGAPGAEKSADSEERA